ncbi:hypothetical protein GGF40_003549 [Coemansia sp. RSA 1286]|nr:hypothetical protein GGF40_003549 [Coemansia sp. RSA 1286]
MASPPTLGSAWEDVLQYLESTKPSGEPTSTPSFMLKPRIFHAQPLALPNIGSASSPLSVARKRHQQKLTDNGLSQPSQRSQHQHRNQMDLASDIADYQWADSLLISLSDMESPDFASGAKIWRLPNTVLSELCQKSLCLDNCNATALAEFIKSIVSDPSISFENQQLLLKCASSSSWFTNKDAVPAIVQSQIAALLHIHSQVIVYGLLLPQLQNSENMHAPLSTMVSKLVKSDEMPGADIETLCDGVAVLCLEKSAVFNEHTFQVMEALLGAVQADRVFVSGWLKRWTLVLLKTAPVHPGSKKFSAMMLHFVNKFGSRLDKPGLDQIAAAAGYLTTPLKKAIVATVARKKK